ncbi:MAG TPA: TlpA disulfide reductase family protein [Burkholderiales bacterium]|nr:TlpA disulfide reductase family protein [Burkholderiales bacterium]
MEKRAFASLVVALLLLAAFPSAAQPLKPWTGGATPPLALTDLDGATHDLASYRGKVVLVNFWATWCGPCRAEMPSMERLSHALEGRPFAVLAVNVGESERKAREFAEKLPVTFTILLDRDMRLARAWSARVLPASYVIGPDGAIRYSHFGDLDWASPSVLALLERLLPAPSSGTRAALD